MKKFIDILHHNLQENSVLQIKLINGKNKALEYKQIIIKPIVLKNGPQLSFVYRYPTKDITKNYNHTKSVLLIKQYLEEDFSQSIAHTKNKDYHFSSFPNGKTKIKETNPVLAATLSLSHDKQKARFISADSPYLKSLGVSSENGLVKAKMNAKYKQINKFIEIIDTFKLDLKKLDWIKVADMGAGKGYLSFALYDYLTNRLQKKTTFEAVELRENLVKLGNDIASETEFNGLQFIESDIQSYKTKSIDILIALHACDTATDDAIQKGIEANASLIVCSPCCHKQVRNDMDSNAQTKHIIKHGILMERQAEILTDSIRALILQYFGYKTDVIEFISAEHTSKNLMITAVKDKSIELHSTEILDEIKKLKSLFGIKRQELERML